MGNEIRVKSVDLKTPKGILELFPNCGLTVHQIGHLANTGTVAGKKEIGARSYSIYIPSFAAYLEYKQNVPVITGIDY